MSIRSRPRWRTQCVDVGNPILAHCRLRWFDNLPSLCDHLRYVDVPGTRRLNALRIPVLHPSPWCQCDIGSCSMMQNLYTYEQDDCPWYYFDSSYKTLLGSCLLVFGVFGVLLNGWLFITFIHSHLLTFRSHILVLNLCSASLGRNLLGAPFAGAAALTKRWIFGSACCQLFAFLNQFYGVFQMTALLVIVIERYLLAKFYRREQVRFQAGPIGARISLNPLDAMNNEWCCVWPTASRTTICVMVYAALVTFMLSKRILQLRLYYILVGACFVNAALFAAPPLFGYGVYSCDPTGTVCTFFWPSGTSGAKQLGYTVPYVVFCGVIPVIAIFYYTGKAVRLETIYYRSEQQKEQKRLTKSIHVLTIATLALWIPSAVLAGYQWFPALALSYRNHVPPTLALIAPITSEAATSVPVLCYLFADERVRAALLGRMRRHYALLRPDRAKRFQA